MYKGRRKEERGVRQSEVEMCNFKIEFSIINLKKNIFLKNEIQKRPISENFIFIIKMIYLS